MRGAGRALTIVGGYGGVNSGDEMILRALVAQARLAGYAGEINVVCGRTPPAEALKLDYAAKGLRPVSWRNVAAAARAAAGRDLFIGGGQVIDGVAGVQYPLVQLGLAGVTRATGGRVTIGGVSTARLEQPNVRRCYDKLFRIADRIAPRDDASSADILAITPGARGRTETLADLVFTLSGDLAGGPPLADRATIAFAVHYAPSFQLTDLEETVRFLRRLRDIQDREGEIAVLAHDMRHDWDLGFAEKLVGEIGLAGVTVRTLPTSDACIEFYRKVRTVISARMHPIILAACAGAHCVPLRGSRKVADMADKLGVPQWSLTALNELGDGDLRRAVGLGDSGPVVDAGRVAAQARAAGQILSGAVKG